MLPMSTATAIVLALLAAAPVRKSDTTASSASKITGTDVNWLLDATATSAVLENYGAKADGSNDKAAIQAAIASGKSVKCRSGATYTTDGGLVATAAGQVLDFTGCTLKLMSAATNAVMLRLDGAGSRVVGGTFDQNASGNSSGERYGHAAILISADHVTVEGIYTHSSYGLGIKAEANVSYATVQKNRVEGTPTMGIFFDAGGPAADAVGNVVTDNTVNTSSEPTASGIYLASISPYTYVQRRYVVSRNIVMGSTSATASGAGITGRGVDGVVSDNHVTGYNLGITIDMSADARSVISGNRVEPAMSSTAYGIEANGALNVVTGNFVRGGKYGIVGSTQAFPSDSMDGNSYTNNILEEQTEHGLFVNATAGHANRLNISGNTILATGVAQAGAIRLAGDCRYSVISGNVIAGKGSSEVGGRGVFLDTVNGEVSITGNRFSGWAVPVTLYNEGAVAQNRVLFTNNDLSQDVGSAELTHVTLEGAATWGEDVIVAWNTRAYPAYANSTFYLDRKALLHWTWTDSYATPTDTSNGHVGAMWFKTTTNGGPAIFWINTRGGWAGWRPVFTSGHVEQPYSASVTVSAEEGNAVFTITATDGEAFTIANPSSTPSAGQRIVVRVKNASGGALGTITWGNQFKMAAWTSPANGYSRSIWFLWDGNGWIEIARTTADVPN